MQTIATLIGREFSEANFLGGRLALDFVNTAGDRVHDTREDLETYGDLVNWSIQAAALSPDEAAHLRQAAAGKLQAAQQVRDRAVALREALYRIFSGLVAGSQPEPHDLEAVNQALAAALPKLALAPSADGFGWVWAGTPDALDRMLWPIVWDAGDLLVSDALSRVRQCPAPEGCGWIFLDKSKNRSRRWCSMETCGNVAKARRHYHRRRSRD
jgi:predicted RNA-binding Zn ribbon-like protein